MKVLVALACVAAVATAAAPSWKIWDDLNVSTDLGIAAADENTLYTAADANGSGPEILKSTDGGVTWNPLSVSFGADILLLAAAASGDSCLVTSVFGELYTTDAGKTWHQSTGAGLSQDARTLDNNGKGFGVAGQFSLGKKNGVAVSQDGGAHFTAYDAGLFTLARYAAFPTETTWYVAAGAWPDTYQKVPVNGTMHRPIISVFQDALGRFGRKEPVTAEPRLTDNGYQAQIAKTIDGGKTWTSVFAENNTFYFNGIDCTPNNPNHCCAVGEADNDSPQPGARIHCTTDGGKTWNRTFYASGSANEEYSLMEIRFTSETVGWAVGGDLHRIAPNAWFLQTTDGGQTWIQSTKEFDGYYALGLDMVDATTGYAAIDNLVTQTAAIAKYTSDNPPSPSPPPPPSPSPSPSPPAPPGTTHYGDPNAGNCLAGEEAIQVTGLAGSFCSPGCSRTTACPTDVPTGTTAQPQCVLETQGSSTPSRCALICDPSANPAQDGCPNKATCKPIQGTGLCTYDS